MDKKYLKKICDIGAAMIENGAEISRAEDSLRRMLSSSGIKGNAFCLNSIVVLICSDDVLVRRINKNDLNLAEIDRLNAVCRDICKEQSCHLPKNNYSVFFKIMSVFLAFKNSAPLMCIFTFIVLFFTSILLFNNSIGFANGYLCVI